MTVTDYSKIGCYWDKVRTRASKGGGATTHPSQEGLLVKKLVKFDKFAGT